MAKYRVVHNNYYSFQQKVNHCSLEARLQPKDTKNQKVEFSQFVLRPLASKQSSTQDEFGNQVKLFEISRRLQSFELSAIHTVTTLPAVVINLIDSLAWEEVRDKTTFDTQLKLRYLNDTDSFSYVKFDNELNEYARVSFEPGRPILQAVLHLMQRIHHDFKYDPGATSVGTTAIEAFQLKRGVCQDFSHIAIACCRSLQLPVRYVSGYVDTKSSSSTSHHYARDVSHAWFSVYDAEYGWVDFDPTNNNMPGETYITVAYGRDYHDIAPLKGLVDSQGRNQLKVIVDMSVLS